MPRFDYYMVVIKSIMMDASKAESYANALKKTLKRICTKERIKCWMCIGISDVDAKTGTYGTLRTGVKGRPKIDYYGNYGFDWRIPHLHILIITDNLPFIANIINNHSNKYFNGKVKTNSTNESDNWRGIQEYVKKQCSKKRFLLIAHSDNTFQKRVYQYESFLKKMALDSKESR